jgi:hypothetical protein
LRTPAEQRDEHGDREPHHPLSPSRAGLPGRDRMLFKR